MHPLLRASAERQLGLFTAVDARRAGYGHPEIRSLCSSGVWIRLRRGVHVTASALEAAETAGLRHSLDCLAVLLSLRRPTAAVSHTSAARLWGLTVRRGLDPAVRLTDPLQWRRGDGYRMTQAPLPMGDLHASGPIRATAVPRTLVDCAREWNLEDAVVAMDSALLAERLDAAALQAAVAAIRHWPGAPRAERAVDLADGRAESPLETRGRLRIVGSGLPTPELQVEIRVQGRLVAVVDAWFDEAAVAVEFDGRVKYTDPWRGRSPEQVRREDELRALGIRVVRVVDADLGTRWAKVETRLRQLRGTPGPTQRGFVAVPRERGRRQAADGRPLRVVAVLVLHGEDGSGWVRSARRTRPRWACPDWGYRRVACAADSYRPTRVGAGARARSAGRRRVHPPSWRAGDQPTPPGVREGFRWAPCRSSWGRSASSS